MCATAAGESVSKRGQLLETQPPVGSMRRAVPRSVSRARRSAISKLKRAMRVFSKALPVLLDPHQPERTSRAMLNLLMVDSPHAPRTLPTVLAQEVKRLCAFDRYEKRALSRRKFAIRALDAARAGTRAAADAELR
jgi:hypothetical protein